LDPKVTNVRNKQPWELVLDDLQRLLLAGRLRERVRALPLLEVSHLKTLREWQRAYLVLSFIGQAYVWGKNEPAEEVTRSLIFEVGLD
jgi:indoleamine 2,3-dioxygenase